MDLLNGQLQNANPFLSVLKGVPIQIHVLALHTHWKCKVLEANIKWKEVSQQDLGSLDKKNLVLEKQYDGKEIPTFKLGDRVRIGAGDKRAFKALHKRLVGQEAVVMRIASCFSVDVALTRGPDMYQIHKFSLELIENPVQDGLWENNTQFKIGEDVMIGVDVTCLNLLQRASGRTPPQQALRIMTWIGRVMGVYRGEVVVTYDEFSYEMLNPAALVHLTQDVKERLKTAEKEKRKQRKNKDVEIGRKVKVIPNLFEVMQIQRISGGWDFKITKHIGSTGTVVDNFPHGDVLLKFDQFERYAMHPKTLELGSTQHDVPRRRREVAKPPFKYGDIVRLNMHPEMLLNYLHSLGIPQEFLTIASDFAEVVGYIDEGKAAIDYGDGGIFSVDIWSLVPVESKNAKLAKERMKKTKKIRIGDKVVLFTGPGGFARKCLKSPNDGFEKALNEVGTLIGYDDSANAVIKYKDGSTYSLPDEYICVPREEWKQKDGTCQVFKWETIVEKPMVLNSAESFILHSVTEALKSEKASWNCEVQPSAPNIRKILIRFEDDVSDVEKMVRDFATIIHAREDITVRQTSENFIRFQRHEMMYEMSFLQSDGSEGIKSYQPPDIGTTQTNQGRASEWSACGVSATPERPSVGSHTVAIPPGVRQVVLQIGHGAVANATAPLLPPPGPPPAPAPAPPVGPGGDAALNPNNNFFTIYSQEGPTFNINRSRVRDIQAITAHPQQNEQ